NGPPISGPDQQPLDNRLVAADLDDDRRADLVWASKMGGLLWAAGDGLGGFNQRQQIMVGSGKVGAFAAGDFNGDKRTDLVCIGSDGRIRVLINPTKGDPQATWPQMPAPGDTAIDLAVADMNGDHRLDVVSATSAQTVQVLYGDGQGNLIV